jgi:hypothetical protein
MSHTTQNTLYTSNRGGQRTIDRSSHAFVHAHRIIATTPGLGYPSNQGIQDMAMRDAQAFRYGRRGQELSANDTIWVGAMIADRSLMRRQEQPEVRRDKVLERLISCGDHFLRQIDYNCGPVRHINSGNYLSIIFTENSWIAPRMGFGSYFGVTRDSRLGRARGCG